MSFPFLDLKLSIRTYGIKILFYDILFLQESFLQKEPVTLLAGILGSALPDAAVTEMSAVGGVILMGMALNMLDCTRERIRIANMLPAIFLPILWTAIASLVK